MCTTYIKLCQDKNKLLVGDQTIHNKDCGNGTKIKALMRKHELTAIDTTMSRKKEEELHTYTSGEKTKTQIDHILTSRVTKSKFIKVKTSNVFNIKFKT